MSILALNSEVMKVDSLKKLKITRMVETNQHENRKTLFQCTGILYFTLKTILSMKD